MQAAAIAASICASLSRAETFPAILNLNSLDGSNGFRIDGAAEVNIAGQSVHAAGDVNRDGIADLMIGAPAAVAASVTSGSAYVVFGRTTPFAATFGVAALNGSNGFRLIGVAADDRAGEVVANAGDVNNDGIDDMMVGAERADHDGTDTGSVYVVFGRSTGFTSSIALASLDGSNGFRLDGVAAFERAGSDLGTAGDINGDGIDDVVIGAEFASPNGTGSGAAYVVFGRATAFPATVSLASLDGSNGFRIAGAAALDGAGSAARSAGDVNHDGVDDLIIGAPGADPHGGDSGSVYVVHGRADAFPATLSLADLNGVNGFRLDGALSGDNTGSAVSGAGDVNGDGVDDMMIGAIAADPGGSLSGRAYVVFGSSNPVPAARDLSALNGSNGFRVDGQQGGDFLGVAVGTAGDFNRDGIDDLAIGAHGTDVHGGGSGSVYVVFGKNTGFAATTNLSMLNGSNGLRLDGPVAGDSAGYSVGRAGDVNRDGIVDIIIGAPNASPGGLAIAGSSYVVFGRDTGKIFSNNFE